MTKAAKKTTRKKNVKKSSSPRKSTKTAAKIRRPLRKAEAKRQKDRVIAHEPPARRPSKLEEIRFLAGQDSPAKETWRTFRIMAEFVNGLETLGEITKGVSMFGSARIKPGSAYYNLAVETGKALGQKGFTVITGGGPGAMEASNKGAHLANARSIGLNIKLPFETHVNPYVDTSCDFNFFFVRKVMLVKYARAFVILPGGMGTMDEMFEALTLAQTGKIENFPIIMMGKKYWSPLLEWLRNTMLAEGMIAESDFEHIYLTDSPKEATAIAEKYFKRYVRSLKREIVQ